MERYFRLFLLGIFVMFGFINNASAASVATSFQLPLADYPVDDACRKWKWYGDFNGDGDSEYHIADDACAPAGTDVHAVANGTVMYAGSYTACPNWQYLIIVQHTLPDGSLVNSIYGHIAPIDGISAGVDVMKGQHIGNLVSMDCWADHIHFGIYVGSFENIACYGPGNCLASGYSPSVGNYTDPVDFVVNHDSTIITSTFSVHLMTIEPNASNQFDIYGYEVTGSGDTTTLSGDYFSYLNTGATSTILSWLAGDVDGDTWDDVVRVRTSNGYTYAHTYLSNGTGGLHTQTRWKKTSGTATHTFLNDVDADGTADLILAFANTNSTLTWKYFLSTGSGFDDAVIWSSSFGTTSSVLLVGDFNGNDQSEVLAGTVNGGGVELAWQRLDTAGNSTTIATGWGTPTNEYVVADLNDDGRTDFLRIDETDNAVEVDLAQYSSTTQSLTISPMATDVGGTDGDYTVYPLDYLDGYADLIRSNGTTLYLARNNAGSSLEQQSDQSVLVSGLSLTDSQAKLLFGNFGTRTSTTIQAIDGNTVDADDDAEDTLIDPSTFTYTSLDLTGQAPVDYTASYTNIGMTIDPYTQAYHVVFTGTDGNVYQLSSEAEGTAGSRTSMTLSAYAWVPYVYPTTSTIPIFDPITQDQFNLFVGEDQDLWYLQQDGVTGGITSTDASAHYWVQYCDSPDPSGYVDPNTGDLHLVFIDVNYHVWQMIRDGSTGGWISQDLTSLTGLTVYPGTSAQGFMDPLIGDHYLLFTASDRRVKLLTSSNTSTWSTTDLPGLAPVDYTISTPVGFVHPTTEEFYVYLLGENNRVYQIHYNLSTWSGTDLSSLASVPYSQPGTSLSAVVNPMTGDILVTFQGDNERINQFRYRNGVWTATDLTSQAPVDWASPTSTPTTSIDPITGAEWTVFLGDTNRVQSIRHGP